MKKYQLFFSSSFHRSIVLKSQSDGAFISSCL